MSQVPMLGFACVDCYVLAISRYEKLYQHVKSRDTLLKQRADQEVSCNESMLYLSSKCVNYACERCEMHTVILGLYCACN